MWVLQMQAYCNIVFLIKKKKLRNCGNMFVSVVLLQNIAKNTKKKRTNINTYQLTTISQKQISVSTFGLNVTIGEGVGAFVGCRDGTFVGFIVGVGKVGPIFASVHNVCMYVCVCVCVCGEDNVEKKTKKKHDTSCWCLRDCG